MTRSRINRGGDPVPTRNERDRRSNADVAPEVQAEVLAADRPRLSRDPQPQQPAESSQRPRTANGPAADIDSGRARLRRNAVASGETGRATERAKATEPQMPGMVRLDSPSDHRLVVSFAQEAWTDCEAELLSLARALCGPATAVVLCRIGRSGRDASAAGADRLIQLDQTDTQSQRAQILAACRQLDPAHILLPHNQAGADLARFLAATLAVRPALGVAQIRSGTVLVPSAGVKSEHKRPLARVMSIRDIACRNIAPAELREARVIDLDAPQKTTEALTDNGLLDTDMSMLPLEEAEFIVSAGDGVSDFATFEAVARALSGTIAGSRVVCDAGLLPRHRQVGASGHIARAECYFALGISGAPQHLEGIRDCVHVVAVNTDLHAAMVERADLAIIADAQQVMPALLRAQGGSHG